MKNKTNMVKKEWIDKGYVDEPIDKSIDLKADRKSTRLNSSH